MARARPRATGERLTHPAAVEVFDEEWSEPAGGLEVGAVPLEQPRADDATGRVESHLSVHEVAGGERELRVDGRGAVDAHGREAAPHVMAK